MDPLIIIWSIMCFYQNSEDFSSNLGNSSLFENRNL